MICILCTLCLMFTPIHIISNAETNSITPLTIAEKMHNLGIILGNGTNPDGSVDFNLGGNLTRAELVTTIVRSFDAEQAAQLAKGVKSFADVSTDEWYSGYVAVAKNLAEQGGNILGRSADSFDPNTSVSKVEALVFAMKFLGIKVNASGSNWYEDWVAKAIELGIINEVDAATVLDNPSSPASRGEAFVILDFGYSAKVLEGGKSLYTSNVDSEPPQLTIDEGYLKETDADAVTISGRVSDNKQNVTLHSSHTTSSILVTNGAWSIKVPLKDGANVIEFTAEDLAGNTTTKSVTIQRIAIKSIQLSAYEISMRVGDFYTFNATVIGTDNKPLTDIPVTWSATGGSIDSHGKFTSNTEGTFTITATAENKSISAVAYVTKPAPEPEYEPSPTPLPFIPLIDLIGLNNNDTDDVNIDLIPSISQSDRSNIIFDATGLPSWITIFNGCLMGTIPPNAYGTFDVTIRASASGYQSISKSFIWTITDINHAPVWRNLQEGLLSLSNEYYYMPTDLTQYVNDPDGDELFFESSDLPSDLNLRTDGELTGGSPGSTYNFKVKVWDRLDPFDPDRLGSEVDIKYTIEN